MLQFEYMSLIYLESVRTDRTLKPPGMLLKTSACSVRQTKTDRVFVHREEWDRQKQEKERPESALSRPVPCPITMLFIISR